MRQREWEECLWWCVCLCVSVCFPSRVCSWIPLHQDITPRCSCSLCFSGNTSGIRWAAVVRRKRRRRVVVVLGVGVVVIDS